jgi:two-component system, chemotaxis family, protein-glutamate methylesterase/glutaminase
MGSAMHDVIVIGASAGGLQVLLRLIKALPGDLQATFFFTMHLRPESNTNLPVILRRESMLETVFPRDREPIRQGYFYIAPPNRHMLIQDGMIRITDGPRENGARPAIDPLFRSAAETYEQRVVGVVLSGSLDDGTAGLSFIKARGGIAIAQDPEEAEFDSMPRSAIEHVNVDYVLPIAEIAQLLVKLIGMGDAPAAMSADQGNQQTGQQAHSLPDKIDRGNLFSCPDCGGVLAPVDDENFVHFQCEVGHMYSPQTLMREKSKDIENGLWAAIRTLQEKARLSAKLAQNMRERDRLRAAQRFEEQERDIQKQIDAIRLVLTQINLGDTEGD